MAAGRKIASVVCLLLLAGAWVPAGPPADADGLVIVPGERLGALTRDGTEADLVEAYGAAAVRPIDVELGEGERAAGTVLFPDDERRRVEIVWSDAIARSRPARATLRGATTSWQLPGGLTLGQSLEQVERLNGRAFRVAGFAWDGGGIVLTWQGGRLAAALGEAVLVFFAADESAQQRPEFLEVQGDRPFASDLPALRVLAPTVRRVVVVFEQP